MSYENPCTKKFSTLQTHNPYSYAQKKASQKLKIHCTTKYSTFQHRNSNSYAQKEAAQNRIVVLYPALQIISKKTLRYHPYLIHETIWTITLNSILHSLFFNKCLNWIPHLLLQYQKRIAHWMHHCLQCMWLITILDPLITLYAYLLSNMYHLSFTNVYVCLFFCLNSIPPSEITFLKDLKVEPV